MATRCLGVCVLSLVLVVMAAVAAMGSDPCEQYGNGCSTPLHMPVAYKTLFTPSCYRHDVCYRCGAKYGISRDTCDSNFLHSMEAACVRHDAARRDVMDPFRRKRSACSAVAKGVFYEGVHLFGGLFYRQPGQTESFCSEPAARGCLPI